jgi:hypothetical protein
MIWYLDKKATFLCLLPLILNTRSFWISSCSHIQVINFRFEEAEASIDSLFASTVSADVWLAWCNVPSSPYDIFDVAFRGRGLCKRQNTLNNNCDTCPKEISPPPPNIIRIFGIQLFYKLDKLNPFLVTRYSLHFISKVRSSTRLSSFIICNRGSYLMVINERLSSNFISEITGPILIPFHFIGGRNLILVYD